ncbi:polyketide cyclase [Verrucomicrobiota bacterium]|nr:polyketide cyclase [Verrucomicrobiota bacterium]
MLPAILTTLAVLVLLFLIIVSRRPSTFRVTRSATIAAPPAVVFAQVNDLGKWDAWSPWAKLDPNAKHTFAGPPAGPGAKMSWSGNSKVGVGNMTITDSRPPEFLRFHLEFQKPFKATNTTEFTFQAAGAQTTVTWNMFGQADFIYRAVGLFMDCDKMVGGQFEQGLAQLKTVAESAAGK